MTKDEIRIYKDYPEGSPAKALYDSLYMPFKDYLRKYYEDSNLKQWYYWTDKFVKPIFDGTSWEEYWQFIVQAKPPFVPDQNKAFKFWSEIQSDPRFDGELKEFFAFLYSIDFYRDMTFEEWIGVNYWNHPWYQENQSDMKSISEILKYDYGINYLKAQLANLPSLNVWK